MLCKKKTCCWKKRIGALALFFCPQKLVYIRKTCKKEMVLSFMVCINILWWAPHRAHRCSLSTTTIHFSFWRKSGHQRPFLACPHGPWVSH